jgi:hypothetical protein
MANVQSFEMDAKLALVNMGPPHRQRTSFTGEMEGKCFNHILCHFNVHTLSRMAYKPIKRTILIGDVRIRLLMFYVSVGSKLYQHTYQMGRASQTVLQFCL